MGVRGIDISEWQSAMDVERVARDNRIEFGFVRTNYGANHDDAYFHRHADALERAGAMVLPYVYPLASDTRGSIDDAVRIIGGRYKSCIVDWENDSGDGSHLRLAHELLWQRGFSTPVVYDPKWYWERMGSPDVSWMQGRVQGHWKSWYADTNPKAYDAALAQVPDYVWQDNRGGIPTLIVQFTGTGRLSGHGGNLDLNYFPGTRAELAALLGGQEGEDMANVSDQEKATLLEAAESVLEGINEKRNAGALFALAARIEGMVTAVEAKVDGLTTGGVDVQALANALGGPLGDHLRDSLDAVSYNALVRAINNTKGSTSLHVSGSEGL